MSSRQMRHTFELLHEQQGGLRRARPAGHGLLALNDDYCNACAGRRSDGAEAEAGEERPGGQEYL